MDVRTAHVKIIIIYYRQSESKSYQSLKAEQVKVPFLLRYVQAGQFSG